MFKINNNKLKIGNYFAWLVMANVILLNSSIAMAEETNIEKTTIRNSDYGLPTHRRNGGSRGVEDGCLADAESRNLIALVPEKNVGINTAKSPQIFFYIPKINQQKPLEFVLRNEQDELIYEAFLQTTGDGIIGIEVPDNVSANLLETDRNYHWYLSIVCNFQQRSRDLVVEGWLHQGDVDLATKNELNTASAIEQAELYHQQGYWYDALAVLADTHQSSNQQEQPIIREKWTELLGSVGLDNLAQKPFIDSQLIESSY